LRVVVFDIMLLPMAFILHGLIIAIYIMIHLVFKVMLARSFYTVQKAIAYGYLLVLLFSEPLFYKAVFDNFNQ